MCQLLVDKLAERRIGDRPRGTVLAPRTRRRENLTREDLRSVYASSVPIEYAVERRSADTEQLGEFGDGLLVGLVELEQVLLLGGRES
jgi:hypothetical protein